MVVFISQFEKIYFDMLYDRFIHMTDTGKFAGNISAEDLESLLYQTAKYFYGYRIKE